MSNKPIKLAVLSLIGLLGLVSCSSESEVVAKPSNYDDPIVSFVGNTEDIHHDVLSIIYDAMREGSLSSKVLDEALYRYATSVFGSYNKLTAKDDATTLKDAYLSYEKENTTAVIDAFIKSHKAYWEYNGDGEHIDAQGNVIAEGADWAPTSTEREHVTSKWLAIEARIAEAMFKKISGASTYVNKHYFSESDFLKALHQEGKKVSYQKNIKKIIIPYTVEGEDVFEEFEDFNGNKQIALHRDYYQDSADIDTTAGDYSKCKFTYIEDEIIPTIYNDLLVEQYLLDEDIASVRNSRARKINVIKIEKYSSFTNNADMLVDKLVEEIYANKPAADAAHVETDPAKIEAFGTGLFEKYATISKGLYGQINDPDKVWVGESASEIVKDLNGLASDVYFKKEVTIGSEKIEYYNKTTYGDLVEDYKKVADVTDYNLMSDTKYTTFTSSGTRTIAEGFEQQKIDIMQKESITKGWYIQSQTPSLDNAGTINERLFKLSVANGKVEIGKVSDGVSQETIDAAIKEIEATDRYVLKNGSWVLRDAAAKDENKFICSINGSYFLKFKGQYSGDDWKNDIVYDDGDAYYIVQVLEAAKDAKLRNTSNTSYAKERGQEFMDEVVDEVAKIVGETGNYTNLSRDHWLEKMDLKYHDQKVYDYFKENYPDLFD